MQQLTFHPAWDRTISDKDRKHIQQVFEQSLLLKSKPIQFTTIRHAFNYKDDLLVTVIIHNTLSSPVTHNQLEISYIQGNNIVAQHHFQLDYETLEGHTSMPWTFIFPTSKYTKVDKDIYGTLEII